MRAACAANAKTGLPVQGHSGHLCPSSRGRRSAGLSLSFVDLTALSIEALSGPPLRLVAMAHDIVLPNLPVVAFGHRPGSAALSCRILHPPVGPRGLLRYPRDRPCRCTGYGGATASAHETAGSPPSWRWPGFVRDRSLRRSAVHGPASRYRRRSPISRAPKQTAKSQSKCTEMPA